MKMGVNTKAKGFTLIEVMVALAVVAVALPALLFTLFQQIDGTEYLRDRTIASWVASNKLTELRLMVAKEQTLSLSEASGEADMANRTWHWWLRREATEIPNFYRIEIRVAVTEADKDRPLQTLIAFLSPERPLATQ